MIRVDNPNLEQLRTAAAKLRPLLDRIVFVGGCVTGLLITDPAAAPVRPTLDVDVISELPSYAEFTALEDRLRQIGFRQSQAEGAPICRWLIDDLIVDVTPADPAILGFSDRWYRPALMNFMTVAIADSEIRIITAPYFLATKLEAFRGRGQNNFRSHDLEDIIAVVDGRPELIAEVELDSEDLQRYLSEEFRKLLSDADFLEALPGHLLPDPASQQRVGLVVNRIRQMVLEG